MSTGRDVIVGIDLGASGSRLIAARLGSDEIIARLDGPPLSANATAGGAGAGFLPLATELRSIQGPVRVRAVVAGIAGFSTLVADAKQLRDELCRAFDAERGALASDVVTAHAGALVGQPGAVLAAGTGAVALGTDLGAVWHQVDGWGVLLGDLGSGAWIGMEALRRAAATLDGRMGSRVSALAVAAVARFGPLETWPSQVYPRPDRAGVLASFVPDIAMLAVDGDEEAKAVLRAASIHLADTLSAALVPGVPELVALTGGLFAMPGPLLRDPVLAAVRSKRPDVIVAPAGGTPLDGALSFAARLAGDAQALGRVSRFVV